MITIDFMQVRDIPRVSQLIAEVFNQFEAPEYFPEGIAEFMTYIREDKFRERLNQNHFGLVARTQGQIIGALEMRDGSHLSLLFVVREYHQQGIGKTLFQCALDQCKKNNSRVSRVTVNSSPYAVPVYEKLGFHKFTAEQVKNGIRFFPMELHLNEGM